MKETMEQKLARLESENAELLKAKDEAEQKAAAAALKALEKRKEYVLAQRVLAVATELGRIPTIAECQSGFTKYSEKSNQVDFSYIIMGFAAGRMFAEAKSKK